MIAAGKKPEAGNGGLEITSASVAQTHALGRRIGAMIQTGMIIALIGEMGAGKTAFVQGLAMGLDVADPYVTSPTFSLVNAYEGRLPFWHADVYRLEGGADLQDIGLDEILATDHGVVAVEWAERLDLGDLDNRLEVRFAVTGELCRQIRMRPYGQAAADLLMRLKHPC